MKIALLFALVGTLGSVSWAQTEAAPQLVPAQEKERTFQVPIRNVKASLIAWWLDPQNHQAPALGGLPPRPSFDPAKDKMGLPAGVSRIVAVDPQNTLLVFATPEGAASLANTIRTLDRPLRQVEIEARFYQVASEEVGKLGLTFSSNGAMLPFSRIKGNVDQVFDIALKRGKATLLIAPRITAINTATAELRRQMGRPATLEVPRNQAGSKLFANQEGFDTLAQSASLQVVNSQLWKLTPTINNDDTVTLLAQGEQSLELQGSQETDGAIALERQKLQDFIVNVRDGETIAVEERTLPTTKRPSTVRTIVLFTTRIIRRVGDDDAVGSVDIPVGIRN